MNSKEKYLNILDNLSEALGDSSDQSIEEIKTELEEEGMDVAVILNRLLKIQQTISSRARKGDDPCIE